jgi:SAM-dependent methyltransferase
MFNARLSQQRRTTETTTRALYDDTAQRWVRKGPSSLSDYTARMPLIDLCLPIEGVRLLDLGCGEGYCTRELTRRGAIDVEGMDLSSGMIKLAREQEDGEGLGIRYHQGCATDLSRFGSGSKDMILAMFLFNYLTIAETKTCMAEAARVLQPGGRFLFAVPHPAFPYMRQPGPPFYFHVGGEGYFSGRDHTFPGRIWKRDGTCLDVRLVHKTLSDYFDTIQAAGFTTMPKVTELHVTPALVQLDPAFFGPLVDIPLHMAVEIKR